MTTLSEETRTEITNNLTNSLESHQASLSEAQSWLAYCLACVTYYQSWLADPELEPPSWEFPTWTPKEQQGREQLVH